MRFARLGAASVIVASIGCSSTQEAEPPPSPAPTPASAEPAAVAIEQRLVEMLEGQFDSADQAKKDRAYFSVNLRVCEASSPLGSRTLYVEQALSSTLGAPYRQRLYVVERTAENAARSRVFELGDPAAAVGACDRGGPPTFDASDARELVGCSVEMVWTGDHFEGRTPDMTWNGTAFQPSTTPGACKNDHQGARYATSEVSLFADRLVSWDRGYDAKGEQVWGATKGGYVFVRREKR